MQDQWFQNLLNENALLGNRYRLGKMLGRGSFGQVFYAEDTKFKPVRGVAIKVLHPQFLTDPHVREEISTEAGVLARFNHPHILRVIDFELDENIAYIVTELAEGGSLSGLIRPNPALPPVQMPLLQVAQYLDNIANALDEAHNQGLVHRDIKPQNILLDKAGRPMLADFGLASALGSTASSVMVSTTSSGTPLYMAPEQWAGQVGKSTDIYALGVVVYQLITGYPPYQGNQESLAWQHFNQPVPKLSERAPELVYPPALDTLIAQVLAKDPKQRIRPAGEFARRFREVVTGSAQPSAQPTGNYAQPPSQPFAPVSQVNTTQPTFASPPPMPGVVSQVSSQIPTVPLSQSGNWQQPPALMPLISQGNWQPPVSPPSAPYSYPVSPSPRRSSSLSLILIGIVLLLLVGGGLVIFLLLSSNSSSTTQPTAVAAATVATLTPGNNTALSGTSAPLSSNPAGGTVSGSTTCPSSLPSPAPAPALEAGKGQIQLEVLETVCKLAKGSDVFVKVYLQGDRNNVITQDGGNSRLNLSVPPGIYELEVSYANGIKQVSAPIEVKAGQISRQSVVLHVGMAQLEVQESVGKSAKASDVYVRVYTQDDHNTVITQDGGANKLSFVLRPGTYDLEVSYSNNIKQTLPPVEIKEGQTVSKSINLGIGKAQLDVFEVEGKTAKTSDVYVRVYKKDDPNTVITQDGGANKLSFTLLPGTYILEVSYANGIKQNGAPIEIKEGQTTSQTVVLGVGHLELEVALANGGAIKGSDVYARVYKQDDNNTVITQDGGQAKLSFVLLPGVYEVEVSYTNGVKVTGAPIEIKAGQSASQTVKL
ncbi:protein kinase [Candidatus Chlorohelix allophototropha]|uniref:Protein kinase n=1 Tax=Candidatus Chlorohelix allophototropha TaxID=3003348 RepID=A0ABY9AZU1_9CHLR|nr:protein kinase [Chloroflexota bacterium L227-S17]